MPAALPRAGRSDRRSCPIRGGRSSTTRRSISWSTKRSRTIPTSRSRRRAWRRRARACASSNADRVPTMDVEGDATRSKDSALVNTGARPRSPSDDLHRAGRGRLRAGSVGPLSARLRVGARAAAEHGVRPRGDEAEPDRRGRARLFRADRRSGAARARPRHARDARGVAAAGEAALRCGRERRVHVQARRGGRRRDARVDAPARARSGRAHQCARHPAGPLAAGPGRSRDLACRA